MRNYNDSNGNKYSELLRPLFILLGIFLAWKVYGMYKAGKQTAGAITQDIKDSVQVNTINTSLNQNGITGIRTAAVLDISEQIYDAFYKADWFGFTEDEQAAVNAFNKLQSVAEAKACAGIYKANYQKSLYGDLKKYCNALIGTARFADLKTAYINGIKTL